MSSGACRALVAVLLTLVATVGMTLSAAAKTDALDERSTVRYSVRPSSGQIEVEMTFNLKTEGQQAFPPQEWGPIIVEDNTQPRATEPFEVTSASRSLPGGLWREISVQTPRIAGGAEGRVFLVDYTIDARVDQNDARKARTPARVDSSYMYFCVAGQDTDRGSVIIDIDEGNPNSWTLTQNGTPLEKTDKGLRSGSDMNRTPSQIFTCIEGVREGRLVSEPFIGPAGRQIVLQAWRDLPNWLQAARLLSEPALDELHRFLGIDIPGNGPVIVRQTPVRELGGYASAHDTPGVVQLDERGGVVDAEHQLAHAWFGTDNFLELWLREGLALWTASAMAGGSDDAACAAAGPNDLGLDLGAWQVVQPTSGEDIEQILAAQDAAACGIVSAIASRLTPEQWREVLRSMLEGETKYVGADGPEVAANPVVDYREFLDAVDERGLVPAGNTDLDFAQGLLDEYGIPVSAPELVARSEARAYYHQFLADAAPLDIGAPLAVRKAMDDWRFDAAMTAIDASYEVLGAIEEANALFPTSGLVSLIRSPFEDAGSADEIGAVLAEALELRDSAVELVEPLGALSEEAPAGWDFPAVIETAIDQRRFGDVLDAIAPAIDVVQKVQAAEAALPGAGILESFRPRYESTTSTERLEELAADAATVGDSAARTGRALSQLEAKVGDWQIPVAVTSQIENGQIATALTTIQDAIAVVDAATAADVALPEAQLRTELRERFEQAQTGAAMAALKAEAETRRQQAQDVGDSRTALRTLVPDWQIPEAVSAPIEAGDFATAAVTATAARRWVENAYQADQDWDEFGALARIKEDYENAQSLGQLESGAELAQQWRESAGHVRSAIDAYEEPRDLLTDFGLWGVDLETPLEATKAAALAGDVGTALNRSVEVRTRVSNARSDGSLRLAGIVFFGIAVLGVLGLWVILRRQRGPAWARDSKPHWIEERRALPWRRSGKSDPRRK